MLRRVFNHARDTWHCSEPRKNPAVGLTVPKVDNARNRVMSLDEQQRLDEAITTCRNQLVGLTLTLLREAAMRTSEPLEYARLGRCRLGRQHHQAQGLQARQTGCPAVTCCRPSAAGTRTAQSARA